MSTPPASVGVTFCGVGEAFDETLPNTCLHLQSARASLLLDCGFTGASAFWRYAPQPQELSGVYLSHFHGDHYCGLPQLLGFFLGLNRTQPLIILGQLGVRERVLAAVDVAYGNLFDILGFSMDFVEVSPGREARVGDLRLRFAPTGHSESTPNLAVRVDATEGASVFYSGDGAPTPESTALAQGCTLAAQEAYTLGGGADDEVPSHGSVAAALDFAVAAEVESLALVHFCKHVRRERMDEIQAAITDSGVAAFVPQPGHRVEL